MMTLDRARPLVAAQALGLAQGALDLAIRYTRDRQQFGQSVASFQGVQWMLADMATRIEAARQLIYAAASAIDAGVKNFSKYSAMCKVFGTDVAMEVTTNAVQLSAATALQGLPDREVHARRQDHADLRGNQPDPAIGHRPGHYQRSRG
jgi:alkylation response protein AidB-like acyl-CoA dehydrogenase